MSQDESDRDERTIYVGNLSEKTTQDLLAELFLQAGPLERVSIPKEKDGKNKTFGFVTYKHLVAIPYALNIFSGTKLFGKELMLKNRNVTNSGSLSNRNSASMPTTPSASLTSMALANPLLNAISDPSMTPNMNLGPMILEQQQQFLNQQLLQMDFAMQLYNQNIPEPTFPSTRSDLIGSHREFDLVDRNRYHRENYRNNRSKPYNRRSRSRSPPQSSLSYRNRSRSPNNRRNRDRDRDRDRRRDDCGYHRWNHRK